MKLKGFMNIVYISFQNFFFERREKKFLIEFFSLSFFEIEREIINHKSLFNFLSNTGHRDNLLLAFFFCFINYNHNVNTQWFQAASHFVMVSKKYNFEILFLRKVIIFCFAKIRVKRTKNKN